MDELDLRLARGRALLASALGHEFRNPLAALIGFSEAIEQERFGPLGHARYRDYARLIMQAGERLVSLVDDLLQLANGDAHQVELRDDTFKLADVVEQTMTLVRGLAHQNNVHLAVELDLGPAEVRADRRRIAQVLLNVLANAIKFSSPGGRVSLEALRADDGRLAIIVRDSGLGMSEDRLASALQAFTRASLADNGNAGLGFGISIARDLIELHGGTLGVESAPGQGTTVRIALPADRLL